MRLMQLFKVQIACIALRNSPRFKPKTAAVQSADFADSSRKGSCARGYADFNAVTDIGCPIQLLIRLISLLLCLILRNLWTGCPFRYVHVVSAIHKINPKNRCASHRGHREHRERRGFALFHSHTPTLNHSLASTVCFDSVFSVDNCFF
jgi:hypothetical protein